MSTPTATHRTLPAQTTDKHSTLRLSPADAN